MIDICLLLGRRRCRLRRLCRVGSGILVRKDWSAARRGPVRSKRLSRNRSRLRTARAKECDGRRLKWRKKKVAVSDGGLLSWLFVITFDLIFLSVGLVFSPFLDSLPDSLLESQAVVLEQSVQLGSAQAQDDSRVRAVLSLENLSQLWPRDEGRERAEEGIHDSFSFCPGSIQLGSAQWEGSLEKKSDNCSESVFFSLFPRRAN